jgi:hypothetical protein
MAQHAQRQSVKVPAVAQAIMPGTVVGAALGIATLYRLQGLRS